MARIKRTEMPVTRADPPALTIEDREDQLIALAMDLAEQRLRDGTASNQLIAEFVRHGTLRAQLEKEKLKRENEMLRVKAEAIEAQKHTDEIYKKALDAMRSYSGLGGYEDNECEEDYS